MAADTPWTNPETIKILPLLVFAAKQAKHSGAIRLYFLARALDNRGCGWVLKADLKDNFDFLGVHERTRFRWLADALKIGILKDAGERLYYVNPAAAGVACGAERIGYPASVQAADLVSSNWAARVLVAFHATHSGPISQEKTAELTGLSPRVQRNYLNGRRYHTRRGERQTPKVTGITRRRNIAKSYWKRGQLAGIRENFGYHVYDTDTGVKQRLPDLIYIPPDVALTFSRSRAKKAQKQLNALLYLEQGKANCERQFYEGEKSGEAIERAKDRARRRDDDPRDLFQLYSVHEDYNTWLTIPVM